MSTPSQLNGTGIPLHDAPARFFDAAKWREFVSHCGSREVALRNLSQKEPALLVYYRREAAKFPQGELARKQERAAEIGSSLVADFIKQLSEGSLVARGFCALEIEEMTIPSARWPQLWVDFLNNSAEDDGLKFSGIRIFNPADCRARPALIDRVVDGLQKRRLEGEERRKILQGEALEHFGSELTTRTFSEAYKKVFAKPRGRPRKNRTE